jgi:Smg protein
MKMDGASANGMKESILDVLLYLFEHYFANDDIEPTELVSNVQDGSLLSELTAAGFSSNEVHKAFDWLDALARQRPVAGAVRVNRPTRVFHPTELQRLDLEARGFLLYLEQQNILDVAQRELVLDRVMALEQDVLDLDDLKWVVLMVLFNQPGAEAAYAWMETQMYLDDPDSVH